jgi:hypothetical protein
MKKGLFLSAIVAGLVAGKAMAEHHEGKECTKGDAKCEAAKKGKSACSGANGCDGKNSCKGKKKADKNSCKAKAETKKDDKTQTTEEKH